MNFEKEKNFEDFKIYFIPRSREVGQSYLTAIYSTLIATFYSIKILFILK